MHKLSIIAVALLISNATGFLFPGSGGGGGGGCGCQPACQPACPPPAPCGGGCAAKAKAKGSKNTGSVSPADDLELRAQLAGFNLDDPAHAASDDTHTTNLKYFEKLGEEQSDHAPEVAAAIHRSRQSKTSRFAPHPKPEEAAAVAVTVESTSAPAVKISDSTAAPEITPTKTSAEVTSAEDTGAEKAAKCNNDILKQLMLENITENSSESKHTINTLAEKMFAGPIDVICSRGHFSYVYSSNLYCEASKGEVTCIAFRQSV